MARRSIVFQLTVYVLSICMPVFAGPGGSGGGDNDALEFIRIGRTIISSLRQPGAAAIDVTVDQLAAKLEELETGLDLSSSASPAPHAFLKFTRDSILDSRKIEKQARFDRDSNTIVVQRDYWHTMSAEQRFDLVLLELAGLAGSQRRYSDVLNVSRDLMDRARMTADEVKLCGRKIKKVWVRYSDEPIVRPNQNTRIRLGGEVALFAFGEVHNGNNISISYCETAGQLIRIVERYEHPEASLSALIRPIKGPESAN